MRKTIILGTLVAVFGFATLAQASDRAQTNVTESASAAVNDRLGDKHERHARHKRSHERHHEYSEKRHETRQGHAEHEAAEHRDRR